MCGVCLFLAITLEGKPDIKKLDIIYSVYVPAVFFFFQHRFAVLSLQ